MTGRRPVLAVIPGRRHRTVEVVLEAAPVAIGASVLLGYDHRSRPVTLSLAGTDPGWADDLLQALCEARRMASQERLP